MCSIVNVCQWGSHVDIKSSQSHYAIIHDSAGIKGKVISKYSTVNKCDLLDMSTNSWTAKKITFIAAKIVHSYVIITNHDIHNFYAT